jgi:hypothetical protein
MKSDLLESRAYRFKQYYIEEIEKILSARPAVIDNKIKRIKIVDVIFAFKNSMLLKKLI